MPSPSNSSVLNNSGNPPNTSGKGKEREMTPQKEAWEKEDWEERERQQVAWEQAVEDAKRPEERAADEAKKAQQQDADRRLAESLQEEEQKEAERKEAKRKAKVEEKQKQQEKMVKDAMDEVSAQLHAVEMKEIAVASRHQTLVERDEHVWNIFACAGNQELTAEDLKELESILRGESPDDSDKPNDEEDSEEDPNEVQTGKKRKQKAGKKSAAGKAPAKRPSKGGTSRRGGEVRRVRKVKRPEEIEWGPVPEACGRCVASNRDCEVLVNDPNKSMCRRCRAGKNKCDLVPGDGRLVNKPRKVPGGAQRQRCAPARDPSPVAGPSRIRLGQRVERLEVDVRNALQALSMERQFNGWLAAEMVRQELEGQWPRVYLQSINWTPEGVPYEEEEKESEEGDDKEDDRKKPEGTSSSESSRDSRVESWRNDVVPEAPEGGHPMDGHPDDQMQVDDAPMDGEMGDGEMQVDPPASSNSLADQPPVVERPDGIKIEVRSEEQMLVDLGQQLACNWLAKLKAEHCRNEEAKDVEERWKIAEKQKELEEEEVKLQRREGRRKKAAEREPSVKKETVEGEVPPPAPPCPVVRVREINNVVEILDSDDEEAPAEKPEEPEGSEKSS
ncbi:hypothetical protein C8R45DRAFT_1102417 [Mycena sanguinolenta]|nr:hypothetical protein C8R45DRAFT_1102417 [Mycena sanguinolenta]